MTYKEMLNKINLYLVEDAKIIENDWKIILNTCCKLLNKEILRLEDKQNADN